MSTDLDQLPGRLRYARLDRGLTQEELARQVGYSAATAISRLETGRVQPSLPTFKRLCEALQVPASWLLWGDGE
jgi:transcriptional regulator with XRE-family HTH domain